MSALKEIPTEELIKELRKREELSGEAKKLLKRKELHKRILQNIDLFLDIETEHSGDCTDDDNKNYETSEEDFQPVCTRCLLLEVRKRGVLPDVYKCEISFFEEQKLDEEE